MNTQVEHAVLFLPISRKSVDNLPAADEQEKVHQFTAQLSIPEIAALLVIEKIPSFTRPVANAVTGYHARLERQLSAFIAALRTNSTTDPAGAPASDSASVFCKHHDPLRFATGARHLEEDGIFLMSADEVAAREYLNRDGDWIWSYAKKRTSGLTPNKVLQETLSREFGLTDEQNRTIYALNSTPDQSLDISGYAGCGKTLLISFLPGIIPKDSSLYLTLNEAQRISMARRLPKGTLTTTFAGLARKVLQDQGQLATDRVTMDRIERRFEANPERLATEIGIHPLGDMDTMEVTRCVMMTVARYCDSKHPGIRTTHIPRRYGLLTSAERHSVTSLAKKLWRLTTGPDGADWLPIKDYHLIKMLALSGLPIPAHHTHLVIDESHDLPKSVIEIIDRGTQAVITLGDRYQALSYHRTATKQRAEGISIREMAYSVRAGNNIADTVNTICSFHPIQYSQPFQGSREKRTRLVQYADFRIPDSSCTILAKSGFYLFSIMQRLSFARARFFTLGRDDLKHLMEDALNLFHQRTRATHPDLYQYASWDDFMQNQSDPVTEKIDALLHRGYGLADLRETMARADDHYHRDSYVIGRIRDARNREFSRVALLSDVLRPEGRTKSEIGHYINAIYTGLSRAQHEIMVPEDFVRRIADSLGD